MSLGTSYRIDEVAEFKNPDGTLNPKGKYFNTRNNMASVFIWVIWIAVLAGIVAGVYYGSRWLTKRRLERQREEALAEGTLAKVAPAASTRSAAASRARAAVQ